MSPPDPSALANKAMQLLAANRLREARVLYAEICRANPDDAQAWLMAAAVSGELGLGDEAKHHLVRAIEIEPDHEQAHLALATILSREGAFEEALRACDKALRCDPRYPEAWLLRSGILGTLGRYPDAVSSARESIRLEPNCADAYVNLGNGLDALGYHAFAVEEYRKALTLRPTLAAAHVGLAESLATLGRFPEAESACARAQELEAGNPAVVRAQARVHEHRGRYREAYECLRPLLADGTLETGAAVTLARICRHIECGEHAARTLEAMLRAETLTRDARRQLHMALGQLYDAMQEYDTAFSHFQRGHALDEGTFDPDEQMRRVGRHIATFTPGDASRPARSDERSDVPIFIVGMPRSGTSLVEQILSSHSDIAGAGELPTVAEISQALESAAETGASYPECLGHVDGARLSAHARRYLDRLRLDAPTAVRITDKMPGNFMHLGLIERLLPAARVIHCVRDPLDTCLSCYFQIFRGHPYTNDLYHLGRYYRQYERLMKHWRAVLKIPVFEIRYEDLVAEPERISREMIDFCGLPWDDRCLHFHRSGRAVTTASYDQVRRPIYRSSMQRWRNYERFLQPLRDGLAAEVDG